MEAALGQTAKAVRTRVIPKPRRGPGRPKKTEGKASEPHAFRAEPDVEEFLQEQRDAAPGRFRETDFMHMVLRFFRDVMDEIGDERWEMVRRAGLEGTTPGKVVGRLVTQALESEKTQGRKK